jgi:hypothetical protein
VTTITRERSAVDRGLDALRGRWLGGWELVRATGRVNDNAVARDCKAAALRRGLCWSYIALNESDDGPGSHHRVWTVTRRNERPPHHPAQDAGAVVVSDPPLRMVEGDRLERTERVVETLRGRNGTEQCVSPANGSTVSAKAQDRGPTSPTDNSELREGRSDRVHGRPTARRDVDGLTGRGRPSPTDRPQDEGLATQHAESQPPAPLPGHFGPGVVTHETQRRLL